MDIAFPSFEPLLWLGLAVFALFGSLFFWLGRIQIFKIRRYQYDAYCRKSSNLCGEKRAIQSTEAWDEVLPGAVHEMDSSYDGGITMDSYRVLEEKNDEELP